MPTSKAMTINPAAGDATAARQARRRSGLRRTAPALLCYLANPLMVVPAAVLSPATAIKE